MNSRVFGKYLLAFLFLCIYGVVSGWKPALADIFGTVSGIVHDPQHRPVQGVTVTIKAQLSEWNESQKTDSNGEFDFSAVPIGEYIVTATFPNFQEQQQVAIVRSSTNSALHFQLALTALSEKTVVTAESVESLTSAAPTTLLSRQDVQMTPGADRTNSLAIITDYVPGSYITHDQLHIRGGHQVSWLVDGVPVPNTNIASNVGPQFDPKDIDYMEVQRGSYSSEYGDRTYGVFNILPRTGFERDKECDFVASFGTFYQTNDQLSCGGHTQRFAYYGSLNGNRSDLGLQPPTPEVIHDRQNGFGGLGTLIFNVDQKNQLRLVVSSRRDYYQIPNSPGVINEVPDVPGAIFLTPYPPGTFFQEDAEQEADAFVNFSWVRTFTSNTLLTISPFFHYNSSNYRGNPNDLPFSTIDERSSNYAGGQVTFTTTVARNELHTGLYGFWQHDNQFFQVPNITQPHLATPAGSLEEFWIEDKVKVSSWLTVSGGMRLSHFSGSNEETVTSPRIGLSVRIPKINWVFHGFYGHFYQPPPLTSISGPGLADLQNLSSDPVQFQPLAGERDEEYQFGVSIPFRGWSLDGDTFRTQATNFFDHNNVGESNIFIPVTLEEALIRGWELTLKSPRLWHRVQLHLAYSNQIAEARGSITGGLIPFDNSPSSDYGQLDHDQRNTLNVGAQVSFPWRSFVSSNVYYGSGFSNGNGPSVAGSPCCSALDYLPAHTTFDLSVGKNFGERLTATVSGLNISNRRVMLDNSLTFGGFHFNYPREIFVELRYRFHY